MKPELTEAEKVELELIEREIKTNDLITCIYMWLVMPFVLAVVGLMLWALITMP